MSAKAMRAALEAAWSCIGELPPTQARVEVALMIQAVLGDPDEPAASGSAVRDALHELEASAVEYEKARFMAEVVAAGAALDKARAAVHAAFAAAPPEGQTGAPTVPAGEREAFEALRELVAVKDLSVIINAGTDGDRNSERSQRWRAAHEDYHRRQPLAWAAARAVVDTKE